MKNDEEEKGDEFLLCHTIDFSSVNNKFVKSLRSYKSVTS